MPAAPISEIASAPAGSPLTDPTRLALLHQTALLDSPVEEAFDRLTRLVSRLLQTPIATVSLIDDRRHFFKSAVGLRKPWASLRQTPLSHSFCKHVVETGNPLIISDARKNPLVCGNKAVQELGFVSYAGMPLKSREGYTYGSFCVVADKLRDWSDDDLTVLRDLSAAVSAEIELAAVRHATELRAAGQQGDGMLLVDPFAGEQAILHANSGFEMLTGYLAAETCGRCWRLLLGPESDSETAYRLRVAIATGDTFTAELVCYRRNGTSFWGQLSCHPVHDSAGRLMHHMVLVNDITARKRRQEATALAQKMEAVGRLSQGVVHDLNNMLSVIAGNVELLQEEDLPDDGKAELLSDISDAARNATHLTGRLRTFSQHRSAQPQTIELRQQLQEMTQHLRWLQSSRLLVNWKLCDTPLWIRMDPGQLQQVVLKLAANGREAMPGGGTLTISASLENLRAHARPEWHEIPAGRYVRLSIHDSGCGMTDEIRQRAFDPFFTTKPPERGLGTGLTFVFGVMRQAGGWVVLHSAFGEGTCVDLLWPAAAPPEANDAVSSIDTGTSDT